MRIDRATEEEIRCVARAMRPRDFDELSALTPADTREELAELMATRFGSDPDVLCGHGSGDEPICIGGLIQSRPNVVSMLFFATNDFPQIGLPITRFIRNELIPRYTEAGVHRIEAASLAGYDEVHRWLETLGLKAETELLLGYGKSGESFIQFSKVQNVDSIGA